jgi:acylphosphatase
MVSELILQLEIRGHVQGVGYRWAMAGQAARLGVRGWVRNRHDGSVQAMVAGPADAVQAIVAWARQGPRAAVVSGVELSPGEGVFEGFEQRPTA